MEDIAPCPHFLKRLEIIQSEFFFFVEKVKMHSFLWGLSLGVGLV